MQIKKVRVQNYQSFSDSGDQSITKLFALIGKNNSGKSAFINAIQSVLGDKKLTDSDIHKQRGDHIIRLNDFEDYLIKNTRLDTPSSSRHGFGAIYKKGHRHLFNLNLQIRLN